MATKKGAKKGTTKGAAKSSGKGSKAAKPASGIIRPLYAIVIREAIASGDKGEMRKLGAAARKHIKDVQAALAKLEAKMGNAG